MKREKKLQINTDLCTTKFANTTKLISETHSCCARIKHHVQLRKLGCNFCQNEIAFTSLMTTS